MRELVASGAVRSIRLEAFGGQRVALVAIVGPNAIERLLMTKRGDIRGFSLMAAATFVRSLGIIRAEIDLTKWSTGGDLL